MDRRKLIHITIVILGSVVVGEANKCSADAMSRCTDPLKVVTDNKDLGFATSKDELDEMCPKLMSGLRCIDDFTSSCLDDDHRAYFNTLYTGTTQVIMDLCQTGQYQTEYLKHARCMRDAQTEYESCVDVYQLRIKALNKGEIATPDEEDDNVQVLCCSFQRYLHCSEQVVNSTCGADTAGFTKKFLDRMSGPLVQQHCQHYEYGSSMCPSKPRTGSEQAPYSSLPAESPAGRASALTSLCVLTALLVVAEKLF